MGMLKDLLTPDAIRCHVHATDWRDAVTQAGALLEAAGKCDHSYTESMIASIEKFGPYVVLEEGVAMPHAQSNGNVSEEGICILTLDEPVRFGHDEYDPVSVLIGICAPNPREHLDCLAELAKIFDDEDAIPKLAACATPEDVIATMDSFFK